VAPREKRLLLDGERNIRGLGDILVADRLKKRERRKKATLM